MSKVEFVNESSLIKEAHYHPETKDLEVTLQSGRTYTSHGIYPEEVADFAAAPSPGKFWNQHFKGKS